MKHYYTYNGLTLFNTATEAAKWAVFAGMSVDEGVENCKVLDSLHLFPLDMIDRIEYLLAYEDAVEAN